MTETPGTRTRRAGGVRVGVDTGGTFTDVVAVVEETGRVVTTKTPTTPADPSIAFMTGVSKALDLLGLGPEALSFVAHGTTVATNALLEGRVGRLAFVTNVGYEHLLEIARQSVPDGYGNSYFWVKPPRIVPADLVFGVEGRLAFDGSVIKPFDEHGAREVARRLAALDVEAVGVCFLHAYANPIHELAMAALLAEHLPGVEVSISSRVLPEYREYERAMTTLVDAAVKPRIRAYVAAIRDKLEALCAPGSPVPFMVMKSNGGVLSAAEVTEHPITTVLSGPAAGALGAALVADRAGFPAVITVDGGGTSTDVALIVDGRPTLTTEAAVGSFPTRIPMIDVVTVGAGGGSIAHLSPEGTLKVGPQSAGADPGPMCYGNGGEDPTVTDAAVLLGRLTAGLLGGEVVLDAVRAEAGLTGLAGRLGMTAGQAAAGVLEISAWNQANAVRQLTVQRGLDVREFDLVTFGGSGSLLACRLLDILGARSVVVPLDPGNLSAYGLLSVDVRIDLARTAIHRHSEMRPEHIWDVLHLDVLTHRAGEALEAEGFDHAEQAFEVSADLRYDGQAYEVTVPIPDCWDANAFDQAALDRVAERFHDEHHALYGYDLRDSSGQAVEWVNLRVTAIGAVRRPAARRLAPANGLATAVVGHRQVRFDDWVEAPIVERARLGAGDRVDGPAVIEEFSSTVPIHPGYVAVVDGFGNLLIALRAGASR